MAKINIDVQAEQVQQRISEMQKAGANMQPAWQTVGQLLVNRIRMGFRLSRDPWGNPWRPLVIRKGQPLVDNGILRRSITSKATGDGVEVGTNLKYARVHQFGAKIQAKNKPFLVFPGSGGNLIFAKRVTVPARPFMPIQGDKVALPKTWAAGIIRTLAAHFKLGEKVTA